MAKKAKKSSKDQSEHPSEAIGSLFALKSSIDPAVASLFTSSAGPVEAPPKTRYVEIPPKRSNPEAELEDLNVEDEDVETPGHTNGAQDIDAISEDDFSDNCDANEAAAALKSKPDTKTRKRKRRDNELEMEEVYMQKLAREEAKEEAKQKVERIKKHHSEEDSPENAPSDDMSESEASDTSSFIIPQHESLAPHTETPNPDLEQSSRTVFLANVCTSAISSKSAKKALLAHLSSFLPSLPTTASSSEHKISSLRFRSVAFSSALPKKAAFAKKDLMDATTKSTHAYAVYTTSLAAREAAKRLNGTVVLNRHLRVDWVAHPSATDHRRCVFVGNLGFVDDDSAIVAASGNPNAAPKHRKQKQPADVEEGLWRHFSAVAGPVESVRVVRDPTTRVGKGFAYVQFREENSVEKALLSDGKADPPLLPRKMRVTRAKAVKRKDVRVKEAARSMEKEGSKKGYNPKADPAKLSMQGRAGKLLGRAGAARRPEAFVFEGFRAREGNGKAGLKLGGKGKKGKPTTRSSRRGAAWKAGKSK
ncbi:hypothetical protein M501DRAFT_939422 [Patellaria atrata CBS 101060]|uniref:Nucleolar protein 12 n=1 Tax=Patellaria atrata CBS 101060 TaxID=1346257 RepID=A0A9P4VQJ1_9PEZI|nr:hypothetical protein M501DRAFT_939422 [Patellaria atrata CBS 101060]